ncbi:MAG: hypothetical protein P8N61_08360 [Porticoccaceae bacterium]|nr:hypothetical protein [Porticoccaceae bacterium]
MSYSLERKPETQACAVCCGSKEHRYNACHGSGNGCCISCVGKLGPESCHICAGEKQLRCKLCRGGQAICGVCCGTDQRW